MEATETLRWPPGRGDVQAIYRKIQLQTSTTQLTNASLWAQGNDCPSRESIGNCKGFFSACGSPPTSFFCRMCTSSAACYFRAPSVTILTSLRPAVNPLPGCSSGKTPSRPIGARVCPVAQFNLFSTVFDPREWTTVVFWKEDSGRQPQLITPENGGGYETSSPSPPRFTLFDDPDVPLSPPNTPGPPGPPDSLGLPPGWPPAPPPAGGRERIRAEDASRERSRPRSPSPEPQLNPIPTSDDDDDQPPQDGRQRQRSRSRDRVHLPTHKAPQTSPVPQIQTMVIQEPVTVSYDDVSSTTRANAQLPVAGDILRSWCHAQSRNSSVMLSRMPLLHSICIVDTATCSAIEERIPTVPDVQSAWLCCSVTQIAEAHDEGMWRCMCAILGVATDQCDAVAKATSNEL